MEETLKYYQYSPLALAYVGDSIMDLMVKAHVVSHDNMQVEKYHKIVSGVVCAKNQAAYVDAHIDTFSEEEIDVYKRGRNASVHTKAKNASMAEYKKATGFEAVLGFLYLTGNRERLEEIIKGVLEEAGL